MKKTIYRIILFAQVVLLYFLYYLLKIAVKKRDGSWVIGVDETAGNIYYLGEILKPSTTVCLGRNPYYDPPYTYALPMTHPVILSLIRFVVAPALLAYLANTSTHFLYIWSTGFLVDRDVEFNFLKKKGKKIVCLFVGNDIRSPKLTAQYYKKQQLDSYVDYVASAKPDYISAAYDELKRNLAESADRHADLIFNAKTDQLSYLKSDQFILPYMYDERNFFKKTFAPEDFKPIRIVHAPTSPVAKGTPLVRSAIKKLRMEGYEFEYTEIQGQKNDVVLDHLRKAHIVLNQFYSFTPGLFGIEAMANSCAVLMSADPAIETGLPPDAEGAWLKTGYWEVYDHLKHLLDHPDEIKGYAENGYAYAKRHFTFEAAGRTIRELLREKGVLA